MSSSWPSTIASTFFGHLDLFAGRRDGSPGPAMPACSMLAALEWVRDHAQRFAAIPQRHDLRSVRRGRKVSALLAMPSAKGLFHKPSSRARQCALCRARRTTRLADAVLKHLGLATRPARRAAGPCRWERLQEAVVPAQATCRAHASRCWTATTSDR
jgi:carboxylesterase type B